MPYRETPLDVLAQDTHQKQVLLVPPDNDCLIVERSRQALRVLIEVKEGCGIEDAIYLTGGGQEGRHLHGHNLPYRSLEILM